MKLVKKVINVFALLILFLDLGGHLANAASFHALAEKIDENPMYRSHRQKGKALEQQAIQRSSWPDPKMGLKAVNIPRDDLQFDKSPMTGIQIGINQTIPLSRRLSLHKQALDQKASMQNFMADQLKRKLTKRLWEVAIQKQYLVRSGHLLQENLGRIKDKLKVSKKLFATGKYGPRHILEINIRKSELESELEDNQYQKEALKFELREIVGSEEEIEIDLATVPWNVLEQWNQGDFPSKDPERQAWQAEVNSKQLRALAMRENLWPDLTLGVSYTKRNELDRLGDFVGVQLTMALPIGKTRNSAVSEALAQTLASEARIKNERVLRKARLGRLKVEIKNLKMRVKRLREEILKFSKSVRDIVNKAYSRGAADYREVFRGEDQHQHQLYQLLKLQSQLKRKKINFLFLKGDHLLGGKE